MLVSDPQFFSFVRQTDTRTDAVRNSIPALHGLLGMQITITVIIMLRRTSKGKFDFSSKSTTPLQSVIFSSICEHAWLFAQ